MVSGAAVRITGSGLGCPEWPRCESNSLVPTAESDGHTYVEFINRTFTGIIGFTTIGAVLAAWFRTPRRNDLVRIAAVVALFIPIQAVVGGITVKTDLHPAAVATHFILSIPIVAAALLLWRLAAFEEYEAPRMRPRNATRPLTVALLSLAMVVVIAGTVVTGTGPHGGDEKAQRFAIQTTSAVRVHSIAVWCLLALLVYTAVSSRSETLGEWNRRVRRVFLAVVVQGAIGYLQWFLDIPAAIVLLHVLGSVLVVLAISDLAIISWIGIARADGKAVHGEDPPR